jgi:hypothetical protein
MPVINLSPKSFPFIPKKKKKKIHPAAHAAHLPLSDNNRLADLGH